MDGKIQANCKRGFRILPAFVRNMAGKTPEARQKTIDDKIKPKVKAKVDEITPPWETQGEEMTEFKYYEKECVYTGQFKCGKKHGKGSTVWSNG